MSRKQIIPISMICIMTVFSTVLGFKISEALPETTITESYSESEERITDSSKKYVLSDPDDVLPAQDARTSYSTETEKTNRIEDYFNILSESTK